MPSAIWLLDYLRRQGFCLHAPAADPATLNSLSWLADWVFEQVAVLPTGGAVVGFGVGQSSSSMHRLASLGVVPTPQHAEACHALCAWLARRSSPLPTHSVMSNLQTAMCAWGLESGLACLLQGRGGAAALHDSQVASLPAVGM